MYQNGLFSDQNSSRSKLSNDDESSHPINASNTNNKNERKRNINMLFSEEKEEQESGGGGGGRVDYYDGGDCDYAKRIKVDAADGQDNNKSKMYQVRKGNFFFFHFLSPLSLKHTHNPPTHSLYPFAINQQHGI